MPRRFNLASIPSAFQGPNDFRGKIPLLFQVLAPYSHELLLPEAMFLHVNPNSLSFSYSKVIERFQTKGGWQEQHFGDQLTDIQASVSTGAFINVDSGLAVQNRKDTIAYEKFQHLVDLFDNNGLVYDTRGNVQYRGRIQLVFEGGVYIGAFRSLSMEESASSPFQFTADFTFRVEQESIDLLI